MTVTLRFFAKDFARLCRNGAFTSPRNRGYVCVQITISCKFTSPLTHAAVT